MNIKKSFICTNCDKRILKYFKDRKELEKEYYCEKCNQKLTIDFSQLKLNIKSKKSQEFEQASNDIDKSKNALKHNLEAYKQDLKQKVKR